MAAQLARTIVTTGPRSTDKATGAVERPLGLPGTPVSTPYASTGLPGAFLGLSLLLALFPTAAPAPPVPWPVSPVPQFTIRLDGPPTRWQGLASWYGRFHRGRPMANQQPFDERRVSVAVKDPAIALGTVLRICRADRRPMICLSAPVTDRGKMPRGRASDLSKAAMARLFGIRQGVLEVVYWVEQVEQVEQKEEG